MKRTLTNLWLLCSVVVAFLMPFGTARAQAIQDKFFTPNSQILKEHYKSWSLFLVCNPTWLVPESHEQLRDLYVSFTAFGRAIGPDHLAVWFWKQDPGPFWGKPDLAAAVDSDRSARYCEAFKLHASEGPHVVVLTEYPDLVDVPESKFVIRLGNSSPGSITTLLGDLTDKLLLEQLDADSEEWWFALFDAIRGSILGVGERIKVTIKAPGLEIEMSGRRPDG